MKRLTQIVAASAMMLGTMFSVQAPAQAATELSGISVSSACYYQWGPYVYPQLIANNAHGWRCRLNIGGTTAYYGINMNQECVRMWGNAYAAYYSYGNPYSWRCFR